jgi:hypothetical protein
MNHIHISPQRDTQVLPSGQDNVLVLTLTPTQYGIRKVSGEYLRAKSTKITCYFWNTEKKGKPIWNGHLLAEEKTQRRMFHGKTHLLAKRPSIKHNS